MTSNKDPSGRALLATGEPEGAVADAKGLEAVAQMNVESPSEAPAMAMGSLYQTIGNSVAMAAANAVYAQQQANVTYQSATTIAVADLLNGSQDGEPTTKPT
jgi:hypothetical protein